MVNRHDPHRGLGATDEDDELDPAPASADRTIAGGMHAMEGLDEEPDELAGPARPVQLHPRPARPKIVRVAPSAPPTPAAPTPRPAIRRLEPVPIPRPPTNPEPEEEAAPAAVRNPEAQQTQVLSADVVAQLGTIEQLESFERAQQAQSQRIQPAAENQPRLRLPEAAASTSQLSPKNLLSMSWLGDDITWTSQSVVDNRYRLLETLGRGGMGDVILAEDLFLRRKVAVKTLRQNMENDPEALECFRQEVAMAHSVSHPGLARTFDIGKAAGVTFLTMEYLEGETVADRLKREGPMPVAEVRRIGLEVAAAVDAAHAAGIIHRDLKPSNIQLTPDRGPVVMDFGLAAASESRPRPRKPVGGRSELVRPTTSSAGTPNYMAPEQWKGENQGVTTDIYAFGIILFEMLTGRLPFQAENRAAMMQAHLEEPPPSVRSLRPEVPVALDRIIAQCLEKDPQRRPRSMVQVARVLFRRSLGPAFATAAMALAAAAFVIGAGWTVWLVTQSLLLQQIRPAVQRLAEIAALQIDGADLAQVHKPDDMEGEPFQRVWKVLDRMKQENPEVSSAYTFRTTDDPHQLQFVVDAAPKDVDENGDGTISEDEEGSPPGDPYDSGEFPAMEEAIFQQKPTADTEFATDAWGLALSGYAPIKAPDNPGVKYIVGFDSTNDPVVKLRNSLAIVFAIVALVTAAIVVVIRVRSVVPLPGFSRERARLA